MEEITMAKPTTRSWLMILLAVAMLPVWASAQHYTQTNLVSDVPGLAAHTDSDLVNPWGLVRTPTSPWWVNDNGTGKSTLYSGSGVKVTTVMVTVPPATGS